MALDDDALDHLAGLARLELADDDRDALRVDLERLLGYLAQLQSVDVEAVEPMVRPWEHALRGEAGGPPPDCRPDAVASEPAGTDERRRAEERAQALARLERIAPAMHEGRFRVARTVDEAG